MLHIGELKVKNPSQKYISEYENKYVSIWMTELYYTVDQKLTWHYKLTILQLKNLIKILHNANYHIYFLHPNGLYFTLYFVDYCFRESLK